MQASATSLADLKTSLQQLSAQIDATVTALQSLRESAKKSGDMKNDLDAFSRSYASLEKQLEEARTRAIAMKAKAKEHQEAWAKEVEGIQNPKLREKAGDRLADEKKQFDKIIERSEDLRKVGTPFMADLKDIKTFLDIDPSDKAVSTLSNSIWKLGNQSKTVMSRINALVQQIDKALGTPPAK
jgi:chromosome segregation ATPase